MKPAVSTTEMPCGESNQLLDVRCQNQKITKTGVAAAVAGNAIEFYDFVVYAFFAVYIGRAFFPADSDTGSLLASVAVFGVGFFTRPLGGVLIGAFADRVGRKAAMILTVALMTIGTLGIAVTPSYSSIGIAAPVIVVFCRLLQGLALGGEVGPASALLIEAAPPEQRGLYASWQIASQGLAAIAAGAFGVFLSATLSAEDLASWGWRIPFIVSLLLIPIAIYIRRQLPETLVSESDRSTGDVVRALFRTHGKFVALGVLAMLVASITTQVGNYMTTYAINTLHLPDTLAQISTVIGGVVLFISALIGGVLCDRYGRKSVMIWPRVVTLVLIVPLFYWLTKNPSPVVLYSVTAIIIALNGMTTAATLVAIPEFFPPALRSTGTSITYAVGATVFGGTTQFIITWLISVTNDASAPGYYVMGACVLSLAAIFLLPETRHKDISV
ncbi:MFS transporter [Pseudomonas sp. Marseille-Q5117]|uniref:MFS transporter n=1 Tax=Pseudomonas sp. Marseille-Q5117 TaxID=2972777 RepID=UPI0021C66C8F|nr:MFS transporter [Pseudomonas sp. Marseille-Q5117]